MSLLNESNEARPASGGPLLTRTIRRYVPLVTGIALIGGLLLVLTTVRGVSAQAPEARSLRIAVVNTSLVFNQMQETKALQASLAEDKKKFDAESAKRAAAINKLQEARKDLRGPQADEVSEQLMTMNIDAKLWSETERARAEYNQRRQMKALFEKVLAAVAEVAKRDGIDLVLTQSRDVAPEEFDRMDLNTMTRETLMRNVLYVGERPGLNINQAVLTVLDAKYKSGGGGGAAAPASAPPTGGPR